MSVLAESTLKEHIASLIESRTLQTVFTSQAFTLCVAVASQNCDRRSLVAAGTGCRYAPVLLLRAVLERSQQDAPSVKF